MAAAMNKTDCSMITPSFQLSTPAEAVD